MRTIESPGVEIKEYDLSQNTPSIVGTSTLVMGFAATGEDERPLLISGSSSWQTIFGKPKTEAERYFYAACMKVLANNGTLLAAKIPYKNKSNGIYNYVEYKFDENDKAYAASADYDTSTPLNALYKDFKSSQNWLASGIELKDNLSAVYNETVSGYVPSNMSAPELSDVISGSELDKYQSDINPIVGVNQKIKTVFSFDCQGVKQMSEDALAIYRIGQVPEEKAKNPYDDTKELEDLMEPGTFKIVDIQHAQLGKDMNDNQIVGIFPIVVGCGNAIADQTIFENGLSASLNTGYVLSGQSSGLSAQIGGYQTFSPVINASNYLGAIEPTSPYAATLGPDIKAGYNLSADGADTNFTTGNADINIAQLFSSSDKNISTISNAAIQAFPSIVINEDGTIDRDQLQTLTVCVVKAYVDPLQGNKINFRIEESFTGSPWKDAVNKDTGASIYLGDLINGNSNYIEFYSAMTTEEASPNAGTAIDALETNWSINDMYAVNFGLANTAEKPTGKTAYLTSFTEADTEKYCSAAQIMQSVASIFDKVSNINAIQIDVVMDAGVSNIAQFCSLHGLSTSPVGDADQTCAKYNPIGIPWKLRSREDTLMWRSIYALYNTFCQNTRKDCMFYLDGLRPLALDGSQKVVRPTKPSNTIDKDILPKLNYMAGLNTSYGAGNITWYYIADPFTGAFFWAPPSIAATGAILYTDNTANYWDAPAGLTRGIVSDAVDISFNPNIKQSGTIYTKGWNYMVNWPSDGITIEGQKTLQAKSSAFDRINVRRLFLRLERATYQAARYFVYELNTPFTRQRLIDTIDPLFLNAKLGGGLYDYRIKCDADNNTPTVIDANELVLDIALKPARAAEFILCNFYALRTGASWSEAGM